MKIQIFILIFIAFIFNSYAIENSGNDYTFDGFKLGDNYGKLQDKEPYNKACDNDPIDNRNRRFMVYGALPCRELIFPQKTTVMFYLKFSENERYHQPIKSFAYLYGSYFNSKTNFPLKPGDSLRKAKKELGKIIKSYKISRSRYFLTVNQFKRNIYVLTLNDEIIGFVFGEMPDDPQNEQWNGLMQMYQRYTPKQKN